MENYESLGTIGEGTYGVVLKCRHKTTGQIVAIKKFKESDDDEQVKKTALREIKVLKALRHENIVNLLEVFRVKGKLYLVFEFVEKTILEEIEKNPEGLEPGAIKRLMWQLVRAIHFCHQHNIIHRDIKPENLLVSRNGVLKLCDFGFARPLAGAGAKYTEYVSTRWYRAPELLVGDVSYGKAVDVWSIGCMFAEITTGLPLFPGDSDIDQLYHIIKCLGHITARQQELFRKNSLYVGVKLPHATEVEPLHSRFPQLDKVSLDFLHQTIQDEPLDRWTCAELLKHPFFEDQGDIFEAELQDAIAKDLNDSSATRKKRSRKPPPSRSGDPMSSTSGLTSLLSPTVSSKSSMSYDDQPSPYDYQQQQQQQTKNAFKPTFKPMVAPTPYQAMNGSGPKDKLSINAHTMASTTKKNGANGSVQTSNSNAGSGSGGAGAYHLPTLHGAMPTSSSSSSSSNVASNTSNSGDMSPYGYSKKLGGGGGGAGVPTIAENQPSVSGTGTLGIAVPADHLDFINQHAYGRQSMTSHGGGRSTPASSNALVYPYSFGISGGMPTHGGGAPLKPPPTSYMRSPYLATQAPAHKRTTNGTHKNSSIRHGGNALESSSDAYSPKKCGPSTMNTQMNSKKLVATAAAGTTATAGGGGLGMALDARSQGGIYVPPRTSHSTLREGGGVGKAKNRRDHDSGRTF